MEAMDSIKGAQELTLLLEERHGVVPEALPPDRVLDGDAAPIFHWLGIEPPLVGVEAESVLTAGGRRRRRLKSYLSRHKWE
jgi:hypothetical protein